MNIDPSTANPPMLAPAVPDRPHAPTHRPTDTSPPAAFLLQMDTRLYPALGRPAAAWAVLAAGLSVGLLTAGITTGAAVGPAGLGAWRILLLCVLLADGFWGGIWRGLVGLSGAGDVGEPGSARRAWLPYLQPGSPAARLLGWGQPGEITHNLRAALPMLAAALLLAGVLGPGALVLTGVVTAVAGFAWVGKHNRQIPVGLLHAGATILLPWTLVLLTFGGENLSRSWLLALLWTLHSWGALRLAQGPGGKLALPLMAGANVGIAILLILAQAPLWVAVLAALWLPAWLSLLQGGHPRRVDLLWTLSMLVSAGALTSGG